MNVLYYALNETKFNGILFCTTAKKTWDLLEVTHKGTSQVKESKISLLPHKFEVFKLEENEIINVVYICFNDIVVGLKRLGKTIGKAELNHKFFLSLTKEWRPKVTAVKKSKDLATMTMDELLGSLIIHEYTLQMDKEDMETTKKKDLALRILMQEEDDDLDEEWEKNLKNRVGSSTLRRHEEERGKGIKRDLKFKKKNTKVKIQWYKCKGFEHVMSECRPKDKHQEPKGNKIIQATVESDDEVDDCLSEFWFMAIKEEREEDFERAFEELHVDEGTPNTGRANYNI